MKPIEQQIESVVDLILQDYRHNRDIDQMDWFRHPDKDVIIDIIGKLRRILFPGYSTDKNYRIYNAKGYVVLEVGKRRKLQLTVDLEKLALEQAEQEPEE